MALATVERVAALHRTALFAGVPGRTLAAVARAATEVEVETGGRVIEEGALEDHLFVIVCGRIWVHQGSDTLRELGPGATIGELAALVPESRSASATALEPGLLLRIDKPVLDELLADHPALAAGVISALVGLLRTGSRR